MMNFTLVHSVG